MKPRLIKRHGIWHCCVAPLWASPVGFGYTPMQAYREWLAVAQPLTWPRIEA